MDVKRKTIDIYFILQYFFMYCICIFIILHLLCTYTNDEVVINPNKYNSSLTCVAYDKYELS